jgi:hypothetical protein
MSLPTPRASRRTLVSGSAATLVAVAIASHSPAALAQTDRALLDMLFVLEQIEVVHFAAMLEAFDDGAFADAGLPDDARSGIERVLQADSTHLARLARPEGAPLPPPVSPSFKDLEAALRDAIMLKELTGSAYAGVIPPIGRPGIIPDLIGMRSVEARHLTWFRGLLGEDPFPDDIDPALAPVDVLARLAELSQAQPAATPIAASPVVPPALIAAIAAELGVDVGEVQVLIAEPREWPDASLGCPEPGHAYADVITPGYLVVVQAGGEEFEFHTNERDAVVQCGGVGS